RTQVSGQKEAVTGPGRRPGGDRRRDPDCLECPTVPECALVCPALRARAPTARPKKKHPDRSIGVILYRTFPAWSALGFSADRRTGEKQGGGCGLHTAAADPARPTLAGGASGADRD